MCTYIAAYRLVKLCWVPCEVLGSSTPPTCDICYIFLSFPTTGSYHCHFQLQLHSHSLALSSISYSYAPWTRSKPPIPERRPSWVSSHPSGPRRGKIPPQQATAGTRHMTCIACHVTTSRAHSSRQDTLQAIWGPQLQRSGCCSLLGSHPRLLD